MLIDDIIAHFLPLQETFFAQCSQLSLLQILHLFLIQDDVFQKYKELQAIVISSLTQRDCQKLGDFFKFAKEQMDAIQNSNSSSTVFLAILEKRGTIHPSDVSRLLDALRVLNINDKTVDMLQHYTMYKGEPLSV